MSWRNKKYFSNFWLTAVTVDPEKTGVTQEEVRKKLLTDNIESRPLWKPMHLQPVFQSALFYGNGSSELLFNQGLCLPSGSNLTAEEKSRIKESLVGILY